MLTINKHSHPRTLIVWLHGLGASGEDLFPLAKSLFPQDQESVMHILPNAPLQPVSLNSQMVMPAWYDIYGLHVDAEQDEQGIHASSKNMEHTINQLLHEYTSIQQLFLVGFSQGGALALHMGIHGRLHYDGIIGLSTYLPLHQQLQTSPPERIQKLQILMLHGTEDEVIPIAYAQTSRDQLSSAGASLTWGEYPVGHFIHPDGMTKMRQWFDDKIRSQ